VSIPLSQALREHTDSAHRRAEETTFIADLLEGRLSVGAYRALLVQNFAIYEAFESVLALHEADPQIGGLLERRLDRLPALESDLANVGGPQWRRERADGTLGVLEQTETYAQTLRARGCDPMFVLAQHYVRYLGDLSGGQIIATMVNRHYGVEKGALAFYAFPLIGKGKLYKDAYRSRLDSIGELLTPAQRAAALEHAADAFELSRQVFLGLESTLPDYRHSILV